MIAIQVERIFVYKIRAICIVMSKIENIEKQLSLHPEEKSLKA